MWEIADGCGVGNGIRFSSANGLWSPTCAVIFEVIRFIMNSEVWGNREEVEAMRMVGKRKRERLSFTQLFD